MSADRDPELERLLRSALSAEADRVEPRGDGLSRIQARTQPRPAWRTRWAGPALALAGVAAVLAAVVVLPRVVPGDGEGGPMPPAAQSSGATSATPTATATATASPGPTAVTNLTTVWPYPSREAGAKLAEADIASGKYPRLRDAADTAVDFVASFVGRDGLTAERLDAYPPGVRMRVLREGTPVSTVFLVRVKSGDDAPYVVVGASRATFAVKDSLTLAGPPAIRTTAAVTVGGVIRRKSDTPSPTVNVELREVGGDDPLAQLTVPVTLSGGQARWYATLTPLRAPVTTCVVAAWTADEDGGVLEFVAAAAKG